MYYNEMKKTMFNVRKKQIELDLYILNILDDLSFISNVKIKVIYSN